MGQPQPRRFTEEDVQALRRLAEETKETGEWSDIGDERELVVQEMHVRQRLEQVTDELTAEELLQCTWRARLDLRDHIRASHPEQDEPSYMVEQMLDRIFERLAERTSIQQRRRLLDRVSSAVIEYWWHLMEGLPAPEELVEDYLRALPERAYATLEDDA